MKASTAVFPLCVQVSYSGSVLGAVGQLAANPEALSSGDVALGLQSLAATASTLELDNSAVSIYCMGLKHQTCTV